MPVNIYILRVWQELSVNFYSRNLAQAFGTKSAHLCSMPEADSDYCYPGILLS